MVKGHMKPKDPPWKATAAALAGTALWLALAAAAFAWPAAWQPGDRPFVITQTFEGVVEGEQVLVHERRYGDGTLVLMVNDRPYLVDAAPADRCAPYWRDEGMLTLAKQELAPSQWRAPDWQLAPSHAVGCEAPKEA